MHFSLTRTVSVFPGWHPLIKSRKENQFPLSWWNDLSFPIMLVCLSVTTLCHAEWWTVFLQWLIIRAESTMTFFLSTQHLSPMMNNFTYFIIQLLSKFSQCEWLDLPFCPFSVFTPRVVSTAVARYNFAARDMRELSLREGDIVKIYSKIGGDQGWWKGEANGRVSKPWTPAHLWIAKLICVIMVADWKA